MNCQCFGGAAQTGLPGSPHPIPQNLAGRTLRGHVLNDDARTQDSGQICSRAETHADKTALQVLLDGDDLPGLGKERQNHSERRVGCRQAAVNQDQRP